MSLKLSRDNNFDLIRLIAALQVVVVHTYENLCCRNVATGPATMETIGKTMAGAGAGERLLYNLINVLTLFPGVPVFFAISGFLIFASYDRNPNLKEYLRNRLLRIFPGLWGCLAFTITLLAIFGYINAGNLLSKPILAWLATQFTFLQFYTPDALRGFGVGNPNGSLWTIPVEMTFYFFIPFLFWLFSRIKIGRNAWLGIWLLLSLALNVYYGHKYKFLPVKTSYMKLMEVNLAPYLFYFMFGALAYNNWAAIRKWYEGKGLLWLSACLVYGIAGAVWLKWFEVSYWPGAGGFIYVALLSQTVLALAYTNTGISGRLLHKQDISYGVYLFHMPVINCLVQLGYGGSYAIPAVVAASIILAFISWKVVERPALLLKRRENKPERL